ncbi:YcbK family protein [Orenia marismortui]|uniref:YcbK family protein n=1 Tax=Orenia marismortui TaxID=46469 RepID=UPI000374889A|nr:D-Ala-D-Ala carboxypeptidase family metallohydrolase [Orenia marismortui]
MINDIQISKNFKLSEFECKDGSHQVVIDSELVEKLQKLRDNVGQPLVINSAYRNADYNQKVGGSPNSQHLFGKAVDISLNNLPYDADDMEAIAEGLGFDGIGKYDTFIHLDVRGYKARWDERS